MEHDPVGYFVGKLRAGGYDPRGTAPDQWKSRCPGHNGKSHNLSIKRAADGNLLVHCHRADENGRNCHWNEIIGGLNLTPVELFGVAPRGGAQRMETPHGMRNGLGGGTNGNGASSKAPFDKPRHAYSSDTSLLQRMTATIGPVAGQWSYTDQAGAEVLRIVRLETAEGKTFRPIHGTPAGWVMGDPPGPRPLFHLPDLAGADRVFVAEGEKTAEAVRQLGGLVATTSAHGAKSPGRTDWTPLAGKEVIILPDHDVPGAGYTKLVLDQIARLNPRPTVRIVPLELVWKTGTAIQEGDDIVDWLRAGVPPDWTAADCRQELTRAASAAPSIDPITGASIDAGTIPAVTACPAVGEASAAAAASVRSKGAEHSTAGPKAEHNGQHRPTLPLKPRRSRDRDDAKGPKESSFDILMRLASAARLSRTSDGRYYAEITTGDHREAHNLHSREFRNWLTLAYFDEQGYAPAPEHVKTLANLLEAVAASSGAVEETYLRVAPSHDRAAWYVDLGDPSRRSVEVRAEGWRIVDQPATVFRRPRGMLRLPEPVRGGTIELLRKYVNIDEKDFPLFVGVLTLYLRPMGPYPITIVGGEQGSAKSTLGQVAKYLLDPNAVPLRSEPKDGRDLMIGAFNSWLLSFDNISSMTNTLSDDFCRLATRGSHTTRQLYADDEESIIAATRPVIINGIDEFARRSDFLDRAVNFHLPAIDDAKRCYEEDFWSALESDRPAILGAILDGLSGMMRLMPEVHLERRPRMADAARAGEAACRAYGWAPGTFVVLYENNRRATNDGALENSAVARAILRLMSDRAAWTGTSSELLDELSAIAGEKAAESKGWPKSARWLSTALRRTGPQLRMVGITVEFDRVRDRLVTITVNPKHMNSSVDSVDSDAKGSPN